MSSNDKIIVNMPGTLANLYMSVCVVFSKVSSYHIKLINDDLLEYWHLPKTYRTGQFYKEINAIFLDDMYNVTTPSSMEFHETEWITFEFDNEEDALYFKLKYCS